MPTVLSKNRFFGQTCENPQDFEPPITDAICVLDLHPWYRREQNNYASYVHGYCLATPPRIDSGSDIVCTSLQLSGSRNLQSRQVPSGGVTSGRKLILSTFSTVGQFRRLFLSLPFLGSPSEGTRSLAEQF